MNISAPFIRRPVGTSLLAVALLLAGGLAFFFLPIAPLPQVEYPVISVSAAMPGASPETMASSVATPLERQFGRIAGITQMTSVSKFGSTNVTIQFDLDRNIDAAGRDVQAAINAARGQLPSNLLSNPSYNKVNPADQPVLSISMTSETLPRPRVFDIVDTIVAPRVAQISGVGQIIIRGSARPAVRVETNPTVLNKLGIGTERIRTILGAANVNSPKGLFSNNLNSWTITDNDQIFTADEYRRLIVSNRKEAIVRLQDVAEVEDSVEDIRALGLSNGRPSVTIVVSRQPGANIIATAERVKQLLPELKATIPRAINVDTNQDRTMTIRASVKEMEGTILLSVVLVVLVVFLFVRSAKATFIPSISVPLSLFGTFGAMYLFKYSLDNLSLMALAISTGFVVDDAIVVMENITRHIEGGMRPLQAAFVGSQEIGYTLLCMSASLGAVFIPILLMTGIVGRLFREFAVTMTVAITVSLIASLAVTPMVCSRLLRDADQHDKFREAGDRLFERIRNAYKFSLRWVLNHQTFILFVTVGTACLSIYLYVIVPKGFFPQQDTGMINGTIQAQEDTSFTSLREKALQFHKIALSDPAVASTNGPIGGGTSNGNSSNTALLNITLKPLAQRKISATQVINRLRGELAAIPGATVFLQPSQDLVVGGRTSASQFQYTLQGEKLEELNSWAPRVLQALRRLPDLRDVTTDQMSHGLEETVSIDRDTAGRLGVKTKAVDEALYDAFGQRQVSTLYRPLSQYHVVMEVAPRFQRSPDALRDVYVRSDTGKSVPLAAVTRFHPSSTSLAVNHQGQFPAITLSFNLAPDVSLGQATAAIEKLEHSLNLPASIHASFQGTAAVFQSSLASEPWLILAALVAVYIVLGVLYESYIHPITIISTLPSAGVGALLALLLTHNELNVIGMIGIILLIGLVIKNAIMMIDFALEFERREGKSSTEAIFQACVLRFRPILMTTLVALLSGLPLALDSGTGAELRRPLGITIVGGLTVSFMLTLFTTPVVYLWLEKLRLRRLSLRAAGFASKLRISADAGAT